jgi:hypothetical protein
MAVAGTMVGCNLAHHFRLRIHAPPGFPSLINSFGKIHLRTPQIFRGQFCKELSPNMPSLNQQRKNQGQIPSGTGPFCFRIHNFRTPSKDSQAANQRKKVSFKRHSNVLSGV